MPIQLRPSTQALNVHDKGASVPPWFGDYATKAKWYTDGVPASGPTNGFYNLVTSSNSVHEYIQYGQNTDGWAGTRFIDETVTITSQTENADGSITVNGNINVGPIASYPTDHIKTPVNVHYTVTVNGKVIHNHSGKTGDAYLELGSPADQTFTATVQPQGTSDVTSVRLDWVYPQHEYPDSHFVLGVELFNPNVPSYYPDNVIKAGTDWTINDSDNRKGAVIKAGTTWTDIAKLPNNKQNLVNPTAGQQFYNSHDEWVQSPKGK